MTRRRVEPISIADAADLAVGVAAVLGQLTGGEYGEPAAAELAAGEKLTVQGLGNPVAFAHLVMDWYARASGDLLRGTSETSRRAHNLAFSSAAVARSACEYAGLGWWLAEPGVSVEARIARTARLVDTSLREAKGLLDSSELSRFEADNHLVLKWAAENVSRRVTVPNRTARFEAMNPDHGKWIYVYFSLLAHGDLVTTGRTVTMMQRTAIGEHEQEQVWRLLLATAQVLNLATRLSDLRGRHPQQLVDLYGLHAQYSDAMADLDASRLR
jgi:hypothetical protein